MAKQNKKQEALLDAYYQTLADLAYQNASHEGAVRSAFQSLLAETARQHHWTLIADLTTGAIRPDATLKDPMGLVRGHWEAKDTDDNLEVEIQKKKAKGYPLHNIIFEDTRIAVLIQNKNLVMRVDLSDRNQLQRLIETFFAYTEPQIESFNKAVEEFKERVPEIALHLKAKIEDAHKSNKKFQEAYASFLELCRSSLNPNITQDAVDDMLVQHLLTERLIREIFDNPEFTRRNVIAAEIEKVIDALTSKSFDRNVFLKSLDRFYVAIENAARTITEWSDKQHFLNTVYERFFQGYSVKLADTMGIVYTPQPIVDFMCASVAEVLEKEFGKSLGDKDVNILDPCTGTGNFIVNLIRRIPKKDLKRVYREQLFANEIMLLPYYIAALNIEHAYFEQTGEYEPFEGLCFVDTLDLAESKEGLFAFMTEKNTERVERQKRSPITVIIGNPPYNFGQANENDNNKNRSYPSIDARVRDTYSKDSKATLKNSLFDPFVEFFRWATDRLGSRDGIVCMLTNNAFVENHSFDGMRKHLLRDFNLVYHLDCRGNVRQNPKLSGTAYNVFGIQVGVGITVAVRSASLARQRQTDRCNEAPVIDEVHNTKPERATRKRVATPPQSTKRESVLRFHRLPLELPRHAKLARIASLGSIRGVSWQSLTPNAASTWLASKHGEEFAASMSIGGKEAKALDGPATAVCFQTYCRGIGTCRDDTVYDFSLAELEQRIRRFIDDYNYEVYRYTKESVKRLVDIDKFVSYDRIKWDGTLKSHLSRHRSIEFERWHLRQALYRPFTKNHLYFEPKLINRVYLFDHFFPTLEAELDNRVITVSDIAFRAPQLSTIMSSCIVDLHVIATSDSHQCFPFYVYDEDGTNRRENITDWALETFRAHYGPLPLGPDPKTLIRPSGTFSQGEKGSNHLSPRERSDAQRPGEGKKHHGPLTPELLDFVRNLRKHGTDAESFLWSILRNRRLANAKFRRQHAVEPYILDFYCHEARLAIELDGGQHNTDEGRSQDEARARFLEKRGIRTLRFWNYQVFEETEAVLETILTALTACPHLSPRERSDAQRPGEGLPTDPAPTLRHITKWDIFYYVYGLLHHPGYRAKFADNLKRELPRIPFAPDFRAFARAGEALAKLHLDYDKLEPWPLQWIETPGVPLSYRVEKMKLSKDKTALRVNDSLTLGQIPPEVFAYRLGNRSALEWVIDQYQVSTDKRSGITSDPNRDDDEEYIVRLVGQVTRVSIETVRIVNNLPPEFSS